jgi:hypothetical protein
VREERRSRNLALHLAWWALENVETTRRGLVHICMRLGESPGAAVARCSRAGMLVEDRSSTAQEELL